MVEFLTDDEIGRRLRQLHDGLIDVGYRAGCLAREATILADTIDPAGTHPCAPMAEHHAPGRPGRQLKIGETGETGP